MELVSKAVDAASMFWQSLEPRERAMLAYAAAWLMVAILAGMRRHDHDRIKADILEELVTRGERL